MFMGMYNACHVLWLFSVEGKWSINIQVWASALLVSTRMGNARCQDRGTSNWYSNLHLFYIMY